jgi:hypothetical protein
LDSPANPQGLRAFFFVPMRVQVGGSFISQSDSAQRRAKG